MAANKGLGQVPAGEPGAREHLQKTGNLESPVAFSREDRTLDSTAGKPPRSMTGGGKRSKRRRERRMR